MSAARSAAFSRDPPVEVWFPRRKAISFGWTRPERTSPGCCASPLFRESCWSPWYAMDPHQLFVAKSRHRIQTARSQRGNEIGEQPYEQQATGHCEEREGIGRLHV